MKIVSLLKELWASFNGLPFFVKFNITAGLLFFFMIVFLVFFIVSLRYRKLLIVVKRKSFEKELANMINEYLFLDEYSEKQRSTFITYLKKDQLAREVALEQFLIFTENFTGEYIERLKFFFEEVGLANYLFNVLAKGKWVDQVKAIHILSELKIKNDELMVPFLKHKRQKIKEQAILYFIKTANDKPLEFLEELTQELTLWEQIHIEHSLRYSYIGEVPNFATYINHKLTSVSIFNIRMIRLFNQYESIEQLMPKLNEGNQAIKKEVIRTLTTLNVSNALPFILQNLKDDGFLVQKEIIKAISQMGDYQMLINLNLNLDNPYLELAFQNAKYNLKSTS
ncbi:HEAT repeat domain-containing protein [Mesonia aestuariivivens]|uniref:HEAT repeat domain-containing protein n=1 Tax=Mesonia aestuariivivens TaxID=2796128 RepID=A0ABS6VY45_9FLAO|nr:HEAT repeat domain-containing protein [Mesonia aestuariivivens]MBW2960504.1 HEAT repeat domain-containing protein [Mesonia aestuariivivens]